MRRVLAVVLLTAALAGASTAALAAGGGGTTAGPRQNGKLVRVRVGALLTVRLPENGSTGYGWHLARRPARGILRFVRSSVIEPPPGNPPKVGQPGTRLYVFRAVGAGRTSLELDLMPPGRGTRPARRYRLRVLVVPRGVARAPRFTG